MTKRTRTVRGVTVGEKPSEDNHEQAFIEYEERIAAIQDLAQAVSDLQSRIHITYLSMDQLPYASNAALRRILTHFLRPEIVRRQNANLEGLRKIMPGWQARAYGSYVPWLRNASGRRG